MELFQLSQSLSISLCFKAIYSNLCHLFSNLCLQVDELISNTLLNVDMEEKVYTSVINWVKHDPSERKKFVARVSSNFTL